MADFNYFRPVPQGLPTDRPVELVQPFSRRRLSMSRKALLEFVYDGPRADEVRESLREPVPPDSDTTHWISRGWTWALPYYLFSRDIDFVDRSDQHGAVRHRLLTDYGEPPRALERTTGSSTSTPFARGDDHRMSVALGEVLRSRQSLPRPQARALPLTDLGAILDTGFQPVRDYLAIADNRHRGSLDLLKSFGCAFDFYVVAYDVDSTRAGVYRYAPVAHELTTVRVATDTDGLRDEMRQILIGQPAPTTAAATITILAEFDRYQWRYRHERALRHLYVDAARIIGYVLLAATALGKQTHISPAANDSLGLAFFGGDRARHQIMYSLSIA